MPLSFGVAFFSVCYALSKKTPIFVDPIEAYMTINNFTYLLEKPSSINYQHTNDLESLVQKYPYFQAAKALYLKGLKNQNSFRYNQNLKLTAAYTTDRAILFDFITSGVFNNYSQFQEEKETIETISHIDQKVEEQLLVEPDHNSPIIENKEEEPEEEVNSETGVSDDDVSDEALNFELSDNDVVSTTEAHSPKHFNKGELHTFNEWLQLTSFKPVDRSLGSEQDSKLKEKMELIDEFIVKNPKIEPVKNPVTPPKQVAEKFDNEDIMTETLARVYVLQNKYNDAINAYEILSLKYPEKSGLFANQIKHIQILKKKYNKTKS
ncbi:MAG: hypothetical protein CR968_04255 [Flavobacteriia bacterium]|nr:MAG: hypothetical protein CR968_04255 [Flavobacteriia bacterium]